MNYFMRKQRIAVVLFVFLFWFCTDALSAPNTTLLQTQAFPLKGQTENLQPEVLDFRYSPTKWQACIGLVDDTHKTIVGSDGGLYYDFKFMKVGHGCVFRPELQAEGVAGKIRQTLYSPRIPIIITEQDKGPLTLRQETWAGISETKKRVDYLWLKMKNNSSQTATGQIVINMTYGLKEPNQSKLILNDTRDRLVEKDNSQKTFCFLNPTCQRIEYKTDIEKGHALKLFFDKKQLKPKKEFRALITLHRGKEASAETLEKHAKKMQKKAVKYWENVNLPYEQMKVPDKAVQGLLDSCIRNIYQSREIHDGYKRFQVGPTCYRGTWAIDGAFITETVAYLGRAEESRQGIEAQVNKDEGPGGITFSKKAGIRLWTIWRHSQLTGDFKWLEKSWPIVEREVNRIIEYRRMTKKDPNQPNYGLMPPGTGDGGLGGVHREYTNVYWTLAGLKAAIEMTEKMQKKDLQQKWQNEYEDYWQTFDKARNRDKLTDNAGNVYVPPTMKGEKTQLPQRGAWAFMHSVFPGRIFQKDDQLMLGTMAMLDATEKEGLVYGTGWLIDGVWNYAASFYGHAHLWLGHGKKMAATFYAFGNHACPLLCWKEEQNLLGEKDNQCGDMPHNWASAEFIRMVRHMMILERGNQLHLLEGLPTSWTKPGYKTKLYQIPTSFGAMSISVTMAKNGKSAKIKVDPPNREPLEKIVVHTEHFNRPVKEISLNGKKLKNIFPEIRTDKRFTLEVQF